MPTNDNKKEKITLPAVSGPQPVITLVDDLSKFYLALYASKINPYIYALVAVGHMRTRVNGRPEMHMYAFKTTADRDAYYNALNQFMAYQQTEPAWDKWGRDWFADNIAEFHARMQRIDQKTK